MSVAMKVRELKDNDQDFEWYPTTDEILRTIEHSIIHHFKAVYNDDRPYVSVLDCGAGDGRALQTLSGGGDMFAIEKSKILISSMPSEAIMVGTDFHQSTLIDKKVDVIFSNPPYTEYEVWAEKIIKEANASMVYLVLPERWAYSPLIEAALKRREAEAKVLGSFDFLTADREARARVDILSIKNYNSSYGRIDKQPVQDPFSVWFEENFRLKEEVNTPDSGEKAKIFSEKVRYQMVDGKSVLEVLVQLYNAEMAKLHQNFSAVCNLDRCLLEELGVSTNSLKNALQQKITGLKDKYWQEFFKNYHTITRRLTTKSKKSMLDKIGQHMSVDFTAENAYAITAWALKNANIYYDDQLIDLVEGMTRQDNLYFYRSNQRTFGDEDWRYCSRPEGLSKYALELRVILPNKGGVTPSREHWSCYYENGLKDTAHEFLNDLIAVAGNLGFECFNSPMDWEWESGKSHEFMYGDKVLMSVKAFKNRNIHIKFDLDFIRTLNVEFGRLKGWLKDKSQASDELNIPIKKIGTMFDSNYKLEASNAKMICQG